MYPSFFTRFQHKRVVRFIISVSMYQNEIKQKRYIDKKISQFDKVIILFITFPLFFKEWFVFINRLCSPSKIPS